MLKKLIFKLKNCLPHISVRSRRAAEYDKIKHHLTSDDNGIVLWDIELDEKGTINPNNKVTWSQEFRDMLRFENESDFPNLLLSWSSRLHPEDKEKTLAALYAHLGDTTGRTKYDVEYRIMTKDEEYTHLHARGKAIRNHEGTPIKMIGSIMDISDKRNLENLVRANDKNLEKKEIIFNALHNVGSALLTANKSTFDKIIIKSMGVIGQIIDADRVQIWRNENIGGNLHFSLSDEWLSNLGTQLEITPKCRTYPYDAVPGWEDKLRRVKHVNSPIIDMLPHEYAFFNRHGVKTLMIIPLFKSDSLWGFLRADDCENERTFSEEEIVDINTAGQFLAFALIFRESLDNANDEISKNAELKHWYRSILDAIPIPISVTDADMKLTFINAAIENMLGKRRENIYGKRCSVLDTDICNTPGCGIACAKRFVNRTFFKSSGKSYQVDVSKLSNLNGEDAGFVEIIQDITEPGLHRDIASGSTGTNASLSH